jgi:X-X-X-Leu-X-X-Gly heptad repeat protein
MLGAEGMAGALIDGAGALIDGAGALIDGAGALIDGADGMGGGANDGPDIEGPGGALTFGAGEAKGAPADARGGS